VLSSITVSGVGDGELSVLLNFYEPPAERAGRDFRPASSTSAVARHCDGCRALAFRVALCWQKLFCGSSVANAVVITVCLRLMLSLLGDRALTDARFGLVPPWTRVGDERSAYSFSPN
jgi:hypothetical protein